LPDVVFSRDNDLAPYSREVDNLRAALAWAFSASGDARLGGRLGNEQQQDDALQDDWRERGFYVRRPALTNDVPNLGANCLDGRHQRKRKRHLPKHIEAILRPSLRIGHTGG